MRLRPKHGLIWLLGSVLLASVAGCSDSVDSTTTDSTDDEAANGENADRVELPEGTTYFADNPYFAYRQLSDRLYAITEPTYYQRNFVYLVVGDDQALLFDAGVSRDEDIIEVVTSITDKPVAVIPSHLHYDHIGGITRFDDVWMMDLPSIRELDQGDGEMTLPDDMTFGSFEGFPEPTFTVTRWVAPGEEVDLGGLPVQFYSTPGHMIQEIVAYLPSENVFLTGDLLYTDVLLVGSLDEYHDSMTWLVDNSNPETVYYGAHGNFLRSPGILPEMTFDDASATATAFDEIIAGEQTPELLEVEDFIDSADFYPVTDDIGIATDIIVSGGIPYHD